MSEPSRPEIPPAPAFFQDPFLAQNTERLTGLGQALTTGQFFQPGQELGFLSQLVNINPEVTQQAVDLASRSVSRTRDTAQQSIINQLEANNQLTSSVAVNRLADLNEQFSQDISDINTRFFLADVERSLANTLGLFGTGLDVTQAAGSLGAQNQAQRNQFNLANFQNQVASANAQQSSGRGGLFGGLGGAGLGFLASGGNPLGAALGGFFGSGIGEAISPSQTGAVPLAFGSSALGLFGQQAALDSQASFLDRLLAARGTPGTGIGGGIGGTP